MPGKVSKCPIHMSSVYHRITKGWQTPQRLIPTFDQPSSCQLEHSTKCHTQLLCSLLHLFILFITVSRGFYRRRKSNKRFSKQCINLNPQEGFLLVLHLSLCIHTMKSNTIHEKNSEIPNFIISSIICRLFT